MNSFTELYPYLKEKYNSIVFCCVLCEGKRVFGVLPASATMSLFGVTVYLRCYLNCSVLFGL